MARKSKQRNPKSSQNAEAQPVAEPALHKPALSNVAEALLAIFQAAPFDTLNFKQIRARLQERMGEVEEATLQRELAFLERANLIDGERHRYGLQVVGREFEGKLKFWMREGIAQVHDPELNEPVTLKSTPKNTAALPGDRVRVRVTGKSKQRIEGELMEVLAHARTEFIGTIEHHTRTNFFIPQDAMLHEDFIVHNEHLNGAEDGQKVRVRLLGFKKDRPRGEVIEVLGETGQHEVEMHAILQEYRLDARFSAEAMREAESIPVEIPEAEIRRRRDIRHVDTFTIDPVDAKDYDDALSYEDLGDGTYRIGVHIADVTHFIKPGTALDQEAFQRGTSVYLVDRVVPMLPEKLSNNVCSLRPDEDRLAYSSIFRLDQEGNVLEEWFGRTVIHSNRRFSYEEVQHILDAGEGEFHKPLHRLNSIAQELRKERFAQGSVNFETEEVYIELDDEGKPLEIHPKERFDAHKLIEDFMLLANRRVAHFIAQQSSQERPIPFPYRIHPLPDGEKMKQLRSFVINFGYELNIDLENKNAMAKELNDMAKAVIGRPEQNIIQTMAIRTMPKAIYTTDNVGHYGLGFAYYCHFTSPIRRYPDVLSHRILEAVLTGQPLPEQRHLEDQCEHCSERERIAQSAERASIKYKQTEYMSAHVGEEFSGLIISLTEFGMFVELDELHIEGMIFVEDIDDDFYEIDNNRHYIQGRRSGRKFFLGDRVRIRVEKVNLFKRQIDFSLVRKEADSPALQSAGQQPTPKARPGEKAAQGAKASGNPSGKGRGKRGGQQKRGGGSKAAGKKEASKQAKQAETGGGASGPEQKQQSGQASAANGTGGTKGKKKKKRSGPKEQQNA